MLKAEAPDRFRVAFAQARRGAAWRRLLEPRGGVVVVDGYAVGQAVVAALAACPFKSASGKPQVWNEFRVFLSREDHDRLRPIEASLQAELGPMLYEELMRLDAVTVGALVIRLLVDDGDEIEAGAGIVHARHVPDAEAATPGASEITVRLDKPRPNAAATDVGTVPVGALVVRAPAGPVVLRSGAWHVLGRAHPEAAADHVAIPGASGKISRRQVAVRVEGDAVEIAREPESNPVAVGGAPLPPGQSVTTRLPVELLLSNELLLVLAKA